jgi:predicted MFS family arabinose efflux permease
MFPTVFLAERKGRIRDVLMVSVGVLSTGLFVFLLARDNLTGLVVALMFYFVGFSLVEAILPSLVTRVASESERGTAMGVFNMSQYLGAFTGSIYGGFFLETTPSGTVPHTTPWMFGGLIILVSAWSLFSKGLTVPDSQGSR